MKKERTYIGKVVEILLDKYIIKTDDPLNITRVAVLRGNVKKGIGQVNVGDDVKYMINSDICTIEDVLERKSLLIRPPVSNIDQLILTISLENPSPDYLLLDKEIILCLNNNIRPVICINKIDLLNENNKDSLEYISRIYGNLGIEIIRFSSKTSCGIEQLKSVLENKISAFSGQSGVGKSSITKLIIDKDKNKINIEIGELTKKLSRGKHTTKHIRLFSVNDDLNSYIVDTPGFSSYEIYGVKPNDLKLFYREFSNFKCKFDDCNHINESNDLCAIKEAVKDNLIDIGRYDRYLYLFDKLKKLDDKKYK